MRAFISTEEWYPWFELNTEERYAECEIDISEEQFKQLKEMRHVVTQYHEILKGLHQEWKND
jgi:hypothetical protein